MNHVKGMFFTNVQGLGPLPHLANNVTDMMNVVIVSVIVITKIIMTIQWIRLHSPAYFTA